ncbi:MAG TPA: ATP-binding protein, partial [Gammaproteobacteria bacterium]|nr:ATP-binding protein [Gammaproteobacteria bacterium]
LTLLYGAVLFRLAHDAFRLFRESFEIRLEHLELNKRLEQALDESRVANAAKTRFLAVASHDLRQPVHALALFSGSLSRRPLDDRTRDIAQHIDTAIDTLSMQLDALLDISKLDAGIVKANPTAFPLDRLLERLRDQFAPLAEEKGLTLKTSCPPHTGALTDETLLEQIVRNLLGNAVKYTDTGLISISVTGDNERLLLAIADTGRGISPEARPHVFEEFYQGDNTGRDRARGLGLGLAITKRLVDLLALRLEMTSAVGQGTTVTIELPRAAPRASSVSPGTLPVTLDRLTVLVVDDEPEVLQGMRMLLEDLGCNVELAESTAHALLIAKHVRPDIVLSDFRLRATDNGLDTVRQLRELYPGLPAILVTGDSGPARLRDAHEAGVKLLHKPVRPATLAAAIQETCASSR